MDENTKHKRMCLQSRFTEVLRPNKNNTKSVHHTSNHDKYVKQSYTTVNYTHS